MYTYNFDPETGGLLLTSSPTNFSKEPRPVYAPELDILAKILVRENVRLNEEEAGQYLFENGYTGRVKFPGLREIIKSARKN